MEARKCCQEKQILRLTCSNWQQCKMQNFRGSGGKGKGKVLWLFKPCSGALRLYTIATRFDINCFWNNKEKTLPLAQRRHYNMITNYTKLTLQTSESCPPPDCSKRCCVRAWAVNVFPLPPLPLKTGKCHSSLLTIVVTLFFCRKQELWEALYLINMFLSVLDWLIIY